LEPNLVGHLSTMFMFVFPDQNSTTETRGTKKCVLICMWSIYYSSNFMGFFQHENPDKIRPIIELKKTGCCPQLTLLFWKFSNGRSNTKSVDILHKDNVTRSNLVGHLSTMIMFVFPDQNSTTETRGTKKCVLICMWSIYSSNFMGFFQHAPCNIIFMKNINRFCVASTV
jgi:hypothetical protein